MTQIDVNPRTQKNLTLTIGTDTYEKHVSSVAWKANTSTKTWHGGTPAAAFTDTSAPDWSCNVTLVQDWETANSLCNFLLAHGGEQVVMKYKPQADGTFEITATVTIVPPDIGGAVNEFNESTVQMGSTVPVVSPIG